MGWDGLERTDGILFYQNCPSSSTLPFDASYPPSLCIISEYIDQKISGNLLFLQSRNETECNGMRLTRHVTDTSKLRSMKSIVPAQSMILIARHYEVNYVLAASQMRSQNFCFRERNLLKLVNRFVHVRTVCKKYS